MHLSEKELLGLRPPEVTVGGRLASLLRSGTTGKCVRLLLHQTEGPCHDDWCEPVRKAYAKIDDDTTRKEDEVLLTVDGIVVIMDGELYYSASKLRDTVHLDAGRGGSVKVRGFSAF